ncbi:MAG: Fe-S cluster assembly protein SufD [Proteobacteria bacterium]|nr:MAG: Fe-S cluster assembly protein SufD [Pseudomonadota bacterium]
MDRGDGRERMSDVTSERHWTELFAATEADRAGEPGWLGSLRKTAIARFAEQGFPTRRDEDWRYTNPAPIAKVAWRPAPEAEVSHEALGAFALPLADGPCIVFVNGRHAPALSAADGDPQVVVASFGALLRGDAAPLERALAAEAAGADGAFPLLARAFARDGAWVHVGRDHAADRPISLVFVSVPGAAPSAAHPRFVVTAAPGSRAAVHEIHLTVGAGAQLSNALGELIAGDNAQLSHVKLVHAGAEAVHLAKTRLRVLRDARIASTLISLGARIARHDVEAVLEAEGAECALDGLYVATDGSHVDVRTLVDHRRPHGTSRELVKGVLAGKSRGIFNGKIVVREGAQKTNAQQKNENLLLTRDAEVNSKPQLEIEADDVKCSHGSTIGQLDADAIFYLRSRGIGEREAAALLTQAFAAQVVETIESEALRERVLALAQDRIFASGAGGVRS